MKKLTRTNSAANLTTPGGARTTCFGVSQGYWAARAGLTIGTSSLGPCFALIAWDKNQKVFLAHVQAGTNVLSLTDALDRSITDPECVCFVRGKNTSQPTQDIILKLSKHYGEKGVRIHEDCSDTAAVVCTANGTLSMPSDITATNDRDYKSKNLMGTTIKGSADIRAME